MMLYLCYLLGFGYQNFLSFYSLSLHLVLHRLSDFFGWVDAQYLVTETLNSPLVTCFIDCRVDLLIDFVTLLEQLVQFKLTNLASHDG